MTAIHGRRQRRMTAAILGTVVALLVLPLGLWIGTDTLLNDASGNEVDTSVVDLPLTPAELLFVRGVRGELAALALIALDPSGKGGTIVSLPTRLAADLDEGETPRSVADIYAAEGLEAARLEAEDVLNITANLSAEVTSNQLAALLMPMSSQSVTLSAPVLDGPTATATTVLPAGQSTIDAATVSTALAAVAVDSPESQRFAQVKELWAAVATAGASADNTAADPDGESEEKELEAPLTSEGFFEVLFGGRIDVWQIAASLETDAARNPVAADWYRLDAAETLLVMASTVPTCMVRTSQGLTLMLEVPFADTALAKEAVTRLAYLEANVVAVRQVEGPPGVATKVYFNDIFARDEAAQYEPLIGPMEFEQATEIISGVSLRVVLGSEFAALVASGGAATTTVPG